MTKLTRRIPDDTDAMTQHKSQEKEQYKKKKIYKAEILQFQSRSG